MSKTEKTLLIIAVILIITTSGIIYFKPFEAQKKSWLKSFVSKDKSTTNDDIQDLNKFLSTGKAKDVDTIFHYARKKGMKAVDVMTAINNIEQTGKISG